MIHHAVLAMSPHTFVHLFGSVKNLQRSHVYTHTNGGGGIGEYNTIGFGMQAIGPHSFGYFDRMYSILEL